MGSCCSLYARNKEHYKNITKDGKSLNEDGYVKKESMGGKLEGLDDAHPMANYVFPRKSTEKAD